MPKSFKIVPFLWIYMIVNEGDGFPIEINWMLLDHFSSCSDTCFEAIGIVLRVWRVKQLLKKFSKCEIRRTHLSADFLHKPFAPVPY